MADLKLLFESAAREQGLQIVEWLADSRVVIEHQGRQSTVSLDNLYRNMDRDGAEAEHVKHFVSALINTFSPIPEWAEARTGLRYLLESSDIDLGEAISRPVSEMCVQCLVYSDPAEASIRFVTPDDIAEWGVQGAEPFEAADQNMNKLLSSTSLAIEPVGDHSLGLLETDSIFKASLLTAPALREFIEPTLGWPVYAVIPCRDFAYLVPEQDKDLISRLGAVVVREFENSGYPVSTEVFFVSDDGVEAIGAFSPTPSAT